MKKALIIAPLARTSGAMRITLELLGYQVLETSVSSAGLVVAQAVKPHLVLVDNQLSGITSSLQVCRMLKARSACTPVLLVGQPGDLGAGRQAALQAGADGWLAAPFEPSELLAMVERPLSVLT